jgi:hypothetical protein
VNKMRLQDLKTHAEANTFLEKAYLPEHNRQFRRIPGPARGLSSPGPAGGRVGGSFHLETVRVIGNDWVVRHDNRYSQVQAQARHYAPAKGKVRACE